MSGPEKPTLLKISSALAMSLPVICVINLILLGVASRHQDWAQAGTLNVSGVVVQGNGRMGLQAFCPDTAFWTASHKIDELNETLEDSWTPSDAPGCYAIEDSCTVTQCFWNQSTLSTTTDEEYAVCGKWDWFNPAPFSATDPFYENLGFFPGGGNCSAYFAARVFHIMALVVQAFAFMCSIALLVFHKQGIEPQHEYASQAMAFLMLTVCLFTMTAVCIWEVNIMGPAADHVTKGSGFWCEVAVCVISGVAIVIPGALLKLPHPEVQETKATPAVASGGTRFGLINDKSSSDQELESLKKQLAAKEEEVERLQSELHKAQAAGGGLQEFASAVSAAPAADDEEKGSSSV